MVDMVLEGLGAEDIAELKDAISKALPIVQELEDNLEGRDTSAVLAACLMLVAVQTEKMELDEVMLFASSVIVAMRRS